MIIRLLLTLFLAISAHAAGTWNGVAITTWNGIAATSWNGTSISFPGSGESVQDELNDAVALYFKLDEAADVDADDTGPNNLDATQVNTPGTRAGIVGTSRDFISTSSERFTITDNAAFSVGSEVPFSVSVWVKSDVFGGNRGIVSHYDTASNQRSWAIRYNNTTSRYEVLCSNDGTAFVTISADSFGAPGTGSWHHIVFWHNPVANTLNIRVNGGTVDSIAHTTGLHNSTTVFAIGSYAAANFWDGTIDELQVSKRLWSEAAQQYLYNSGNGRTLPY